MSTIRITKGKLPTSRQFRRMLRKAVAESNPLDDLLDLTRKLRDYEVRYDLTSEMFYERFQRGELDDELQHCLAWAATYEMFLTLRDRLEAALVRDAVWRGQTARTPA